MMRIWYLVVSVGLVCWPLGSTVGSAQEPDQKQKEGQQPTDEQKEITAPEQLNGMFDETVFVTANVIRASSLESSISVSTLDAAAVAESAPRSTAEVLRNIPGIRSESTGGEGNANIAVRGLPVAAGGAKFLQLHEDGLPVLEFGDVAFGNADIFLRNDDSLDRIEAVRGGTASTQASNSPGGVINFLSQVGAGRAGNIGVTQGIDHPSTRVDLGYGRPIGKEWGFHLGGFFRSGDGLRDPGYTAEKGYQVKGNLSRYFQQGYVRIYAKRLDDRAIGYLPMPVLATGSNSHPSLAGFDSFDPGSDTLHTPNLLRDIGLDGDNRRRVTDVADGMHPISTALGVESYFDLGSGWTVREKLRVSKNNGGFVSPFPASITNATLAAESIGGAGSSLVYANGPKAGQAYGGLVVNTVLFNTAINDFGNGINDLQVGKLFGADWGALSLKAGYYKSRQNIDMDWVWNSYLMELNGHDGALLDVIDGGSGRGSQGGLYGYGVPAWGNCCQRSYDTHYDIDAPYAAVSLSKGSLSADVSARLDLGRAKGSYAGARQVENFDVDGNGQISAPERSVSFIDNEHPSPVDYSWSYLSYSAGANYMFAKSVAGFARASRGGRANADRLMFGVVQPDGSVRKEDAVDLVNQYEAGVKWNSRHVALFATGFMANTQEQNYELTSQRFLDRVYDSRGIELEMQYRISAFAVNGGVTWTHAEISSDKITPTNVGNTPRRQADFVYQATAQWAKPRYRVGLNLIGTTDAYTQDNNDLVMPGFTQVNLVGSVGILKGLRLSFGVNNLSNAFGITEAEEGSIAEGRDNYIRARSIPGRSSNVTLSYDF